MSLHTVRIAAICFVASALLACDSGSETYAVSTTVEPKRELESRFELPAMLSGTEVSTVVAGPSTLSRDLQLPASVGFDEDRRASISAGVDGVVDHVDVKLGDKVTRGQRLLVISSRELARARSAFVEAVHHLEYSRVSLEREKSLWEKRITSEEAYLLARQANEEAQLLRMTTEQELRALGLSQEELQQLAGSKDGDVHDHASVDFTRYERHSPLAGVVFEKSIVLGEVVRSDTVLFKVADLSEVWVDLRIQAVDLAQLEVGTPVQVESPELGRVSEGRVAYVDARVMAETQTGLARIELPNTDGIWRPGLFVKVNVQVARREVPLAIPANSVHYFPGSNGTPDISRVFVELEPGSYEVREIELGQLGSHEVEVLSGLASGERVATNQGLLLKSIWLGQGGLEE